MEKSISNSFRATLVSEEALGLSKDYSELALDSLLDEGALKDIPIIGTLVSLYKIGNSLKDRHDFKKIVVFLNRLNDISQEERASFLLRVDTEDKFREGIFEKILLLLGRLDETCKAEIIGNLFKLYVMEVIDRDKFLRLSGIVERLMLSDVLDLHFRYSRFVTSQFRRTNISGASQSSLLSYGLLKQKIIEDPMATSGMLGRSRKPNTLLTTTITALGLELAHYAIFDLNDPLFSSFLNVVRQDGIEKAFRKQNL